MHRHFIVYGIAFTGLMVFALLAGWAAFGASSAVDSWRYLAAAAVLLAGLAGFLATLTLYALRNRGEDGADPDAR